MHLANRLGVLLNNQLSLEELNRQHNRLQACLGLQHSNLSLQQGYLEHKQHRVLSLEAQEEHLEQTQLPLKSKVYSEQLLSEVPHSKQVHYKVALPFLEVVLEEDNQQEVFLDSNSSSKPNHKGCFH